MRTIESIRNAILKRWWRVTVPGRLRRRGVTVGQGATFHGMPLVSLAQDSRIEIGDRVVLVSDCAFTALGVSRPTILRTLQSGASISIGDDTGISGGTICAASRVTIGKRCLIGADVKIADTDFHSLKPDNRRFNNNPLDIGVAPVHIGDDVFVGTGAIILKGVVIGSGAIVGAGSVVTKDVPEGGVVAGNPAKIIRGISDGGALVDRNR